MEGLCGVVASGGTIMLNVIGQCETMEPHTEAKAPMICQQAGCVNLTHTECAVCSTKLCQAHVHSYPNAAALDRLNEQERLRPGSVSDDDRSNSGTPLCHVCSIRFAPQVNSDGYASDG